MPITADQDLADEDTAEALRPPAHSGDVSLEVTLFDGSKLDLANLSWHELVDLQWREERAFAQRIKTSAKGSADRAAAFAHGYDTVCTIVGRRQQLAGGDSAMGFDARYVGLVLHVLARTQRTGATQQLFEIGYGSGALLAALAERGILVAGVEVSASMRAKALAGEPPSSADRLLLGDFLSIPLEQHTGQYDVVYWNDVLEHIPCDETHDFLGRIFTLLRPGGSLITITPNWHVRPSDITHGFRPGRSEAEGFHLKEYTLRDVCGLLREAGFDRVAVPLLVSPWRIALGGDGLVKLKLRCEPLLERLPFRATQRLCSLLALNITIARKPGRR